MSRQVSERILSALARLERGKPTNKQLLARLQAGKKVKVNVSTVALEAPVSRRLIGFDGCEYQSEREKIQKSEGVSTRQQNYQDRAKELSKRCRELGKALAVRDTVIASMATELERLRAKLGDDGNVVEFRRRDRRKTGSNANSEAKSSR